MQLNRQNVIVLTISAIMVFLVVALLLVRFLPPPRKDSDYLVIGAVSTLAALGVVFGALLQRGGIQDTFFKRRK
jgi:hypothetical protein